MPRPRFDEPNAGDRYAAYPLASWCPPFRPCCALLGGRRVMMARIIERSLIFLALHAGFIAAALTAYAV